MGKYLSLILAFLLLSNSAFAGLPPTTIKGQADTVKSGISNIETPNKLATQTGAGTYLIENGNNNLLQNPSFEHSTFNTGWTCTGVTPTEETSVVAPGSKKSMKLTLSAATGECYQDSTIGASQASGVQFLAMARLKAALTAGTIKLCARQAGVTSTSLCNSNVDDTFNFREMPFTGSATSNGVSIVFTGATGTAYVDDAFVGAVKVGQSYDASKLLGTANWTITTNCAWDNTSTSYSDFPVDADCPTPTVTGGISAPVTKIPAVILNAKVGKTYQVVVSGTIYSNVSDNKNLRLSDGTVTTNEINMYLSGHVSGNNVFTYTPTSSGNKTLSFQSKASSGSVTVYNSSAVHSPLQFSVYELASNSAYSSTTLNHVDRVGEVIFSTNPVAPQGFISALNVSIGQTGATFNGDSYYALYEQLWNTAGLSTTAGDPYRISSAKGATALADYQANKTITIDYATNELFIRAKGTGRNAGSYQADAFQGHRHNAQGSTAAGGSNSYVPPAGTIGGTTTLSVLDPISDGVNGTPRTASETRPKNVALYAYIRYSGDTILTVAQISGLESCANSYECTENLNASIAATTGAVGSSENLEFITGDCTRSGTNSMIVTCPIKSGVFTVMPNCEATAHVSTATANFIKASSSISSFVFHTTDPTGTGTNSGLDIVCHKAGADAVFKTARAVASDQNTFGPLLSWQNMTASRALGTTYTNNTGRPIIVMVYTTAGGINALAGRVNGQVAQISSGGTATYAAAVNYSVPNGSTYSVQAEAGSPSLIAWYEYR